MPLSLHKSWKALRGGMGQCGQSGRTAVECAVDLGEVYGWVGHVLIVVDDIVPGRFKVATVGTIRRKVLDEPGRLVVQLGLCVEMAVHTIRLLISSGGNFVV